MLTVKYRTLIGVVVLLLCAFMVGVPIAMTARAFRAERTAADVLERGGGHVSWDGFSIVAVDLSDRTVSKEMIVSLNELQRLRHLFLSSAEIKDRDFQHLDCLGRLETLNINDVQLTPVAIQELRKASHLVTLSAGSIEIDNAFLEVILTLPELRVLGLSSTSANDKAIAHLKSLDNLTVFVLGEPEGAQRTKQN